MDIAASTLFEPHPFLRYLANRYHLEQKERLERQYLIDNFGIYGPYCTIPCEYSPDSFDRFFAFHNWLVTHRTKLKSVEQVMRSLKNGIAVWRYKPGPER